MKMSIAIVAAFLCLTGCSANPKPATQTPVVPGTENGNQLGAVQYIIQPGDNLVLIAADQTRASENWRRIADFNRIQNPATIKPGQVIWIPNDLIPLTQVEEGTREVAGHPDAKVNSVQIPATVRPLGR